MLESLFRRIWNHFWYSWHFRDFYRCMIYYFYCSLHEILERQMLPEAATKLKSVLLRAPQTIPTTDTLNKLNKIQI